MEQSSAWCKRLVLGVLGAVCFQAGALSLSYWMSGVGVAPEPASTTAATVVESVESPEVEQRWTLPEVPPGSKRSGGPKYTPEGSFAHQWPRSDDPFLDAPRTENFDPRGRDFRKAALRPDGEFKSPWSDDPFLHPWRSEYFGPGWLRTPEDARRRYQWFRVFPPSDPFLHVPK